MTGNFNDRINPELHKMASYAATEKGISLNKYVQDAIQSAVAGEEVTYKEKSKKKNV